MKLETNEVGSIAWQLCTLIPAAALTGCSGAPSHSIFGSYFPSWLLCVVAGLIASIAARRVFIAVGIDETLPVPLLVYLLLAVAFSFLTWLVWLN